MVTEITGNDRETNKELSKTERKQKSDQIPILEIRNQRTSRKESSKNRKTKKQKKNKNNEWRKRF